MRAAARLTVSEAAARLGVSPQRVHALIRAGVLEATRVGREFLVDPVSVHRRLLAEPVRHRPLDPRHAWALIALASQDDALPVDGRRLSPWALSRVRGRLRREGLLELAPYLRRRAEVRFLRADPGDVGQLADARPLVRTGVSAAREYGLDIVASEVLEAYVPAPQAAYLIEHFLLESTSPPNVILHVVAPEWPFAPNASVAPGPLAALDLYDSDDARSKRAGREYLQRLSST